MGWPLKHPRGPIWATPSIKICTWATIYHFKLVMSKSTLSMNNLFSKFTFGFIEHLDGFEKFSSNTQPMYHWMQMKKREYLDKRNRFLGYECNFHSLFDIRQWNEIDCRVGGAKMGLKIHSDGVGPTNSLEWQSAIASVR